MPKLMRLTLMCVAMLFVCGTALSSSLDLEEARDISFAEKYCCIKAGCPDGDYLCRSFGLLLGGTCSQRLADLPSGLEGDALAVRNSCMGASFSLWSGFTCPSTCRENNDGT